MLSICVPIFNEEESIPHVVKQIKEQSLWKHNPDRELILIVNGSTDESLKIARRFFLNDPNIHVLTIQKKGKNNAWMQAVKACKGDSENIFFVDADVTLEKESLEQLDLALKKDREHKLAIVGAVSVPQEEKFGALAFHRKSLMKRGRTGPQDYVNGRCYAIRAAEARSIQMPADQRIHEDMFLTYTFWKRFGIVHSAIVRHRVPNFVDYVRHSARGKLSKDLIREKHPELRAAQNEYYSGRPSRLKKFMGMSLRRKIGALVTKAPMPVAAAMAKYAKYTDRDSWPKLHSTKQPRKKGV